MNQHYVRTDIVDYTIVNVSTSMISFWLAALRFFCVRSEKLFVFILLLFTRILNVARTNKWIFIWPWGYWWGQNYSVKWCELVYNSVIISKIKQKQQRDNSILIISLYLRLEVINEKLILWMEMMLIHCHDIELLKLNFWTLSEMILQ